jgi:hypothetical protein
VSQTGLPRDEMSRAILLNNRVAVVPSHCGELAVWRAYRFFHLG